MKLNITVFPQNTIITAEKNTTLYNALIGGGVIFSADCGGGGKCGNCKVKLLKGKVAGVKADENGFILSCKADLVEDIQIELLEKDLGKINLVTLKDISNATEVGAVLDIGTTTLVAALVDLKSGEVLKKASCFNSQRVFGSDVLSRISAAKNGNLQRLQNMVLNQTNVLLTALMGDEIKDVKKLVVVGNTTMLHIFAGENPSSLGEYPFTPIFLNTLRLKGQDLGINPSEIILLPSASAYVGADITAGAVACNLYDTEKIELLVDVGTNGEMLLSVKGKLYATSTAAGPALEGASMECGQSGSKGAINKVFLRGKTFGYTTVENKPATGICGSGYIDVISILLREKIINENGNFTENPSSFLANRVIGNRFYITETVYISRKDISEYQLAKSAIFSGIKTLLKHCGIDETQIETFYLAGGMGYHINPLNAAISGLIPTSLYGKVQTKENSAIEGARLCIVSDESIKKAEEISEKSEIVELSLSENFQNYYIENMRFLSHSLTVSQNSFDKNNK